MDKRGPILLCSAALLFRAGVEASGVQNSAQLREQSRIAQAERAETERVAEALQAGGVHAAAVVLGGTYVSNGSATMRAVATLDLLMNGSDTVVIGDIVATEPRLIRDNKSIATYSSVRIVEVIKGSAAPLVKVRIPGGKMVFPDGVVAEVTNGDFRLVSGGRYALFLKAVKPAQSMSVIAEDARDMARDAQEGVFTPLLGAQGVLDLSASTKGVVSMARPTDPMRATYSGRDVAEMVELLRASAAKDPAQKAR